MVTNKGGGANYSLADHPVQVGSCGSQGSGGGLEIAKNLFGAIDVTQEAKAEIINYASKVDASVNEMRYVKGLKVARGIVCCASWDKSISSW